MFNSKLTKIASAVALLSAAGAVSANTVSVQTIATTAAPAATMTAQASLLSESAEVLSTGATVLTQADVVNNSVSTADFVVFEVTDTSIAADRQVQFNFTNGGISDTQTEYNLVRVDDLTGLSEEVILAANVVAFVDEGSYYSSLTLAPTVALPVNSKWALTSSGNDITDTNLTDAVGTTTLDPADLYLAEDASTGDKLSVTVKVINEVTLAEITDAGASTAAEIAEVVDGLTNTKATAVTSAVDFTQGATEFTGSTYTSATTVGATTVENGTFSVTDAGDQYTITVTGTNCAAVQKDDTDAVSFGGLDLTYVSGCTWQATNVAGTDGAITALTGGGANVSVTVNGGAAASASNTHVEIESATWTYSVSVLENTTATTFSLFSDETALTFSGNVQGANAYVPYMYNVDSSGWLSFAKLTNNASTDINVGVTVTVQDIAGEGALSGTYTDFFVDTIPAGEMATINAQMILDAIGGTTTDAMPANRGFEDTNFTTFADSGYNYHMNVTFTFDGTTDANAVDVTVQNKSSNGRAAGAVFYDNAYSNDNAGRTKN